ncbi:TorF family putative porin [Rhizorhapis sp. SPR117]|uniref:TorF family putative porin n=1 Tax=Rhizorhapis sp. SPR117 TaxID=2912611 RepID=UPI001F0080F1|nr:TorF family putative porin [Rhizorhapis sp. SPR117]
MRKTLIGLGSLAIALAAATPAFAQGDSSDGIIITGGASVVSDYRFRGVSQTGEDAAIQGTIGVAHSSGLYAGAWGSSVDLTASDGARLNTELDFYAGYSREVSPGITADVGLLYYFYPKTGSSNAATDYFEPYASLSGDLGPVNAKVGLAYAWGGQNALGNDDNIYAYTDLKTAIPSTPFTLKGHVGYTDGSLASTSGAISGNYWDWSVGAEASYKMLTFGVSYVDTDVRNAPFSVSPGANAIGSDSGLVFSVGASF